MGSEKTCGYPNLEIDFMSIRINLYVQSGILKLGPSHCRDGIVRLTVKDVISVALAAYSSDVHLGFPLPSLSSGNNQSLRLVIFPLHSELSRCRRIDVQSRRLTHLRNRPRMVFEVRPDLCQWVTPQVIPFRRPLAPRRGVPKDQRSPPLPLACD